MITPGPSISPRSSPSLAYTRSAVFPPPAILRALPLGRSAGISRPLLLVQVALTLFFATYYPDTSSACCPSAGPPHLLDPTAIGDSYQNTAASAKSLTLQPSRLRSVNAAVPLARRTHCRGNRRHRIANTKTQHVPRVFVSNSEFGLARLEGCLCFRLLPWQSTAVEEHAASMVELGASMAEGTGVGTGSSRSVYGENFVPSPRSANSGATPPLSQMRNARGDSGYFAGASVPQSSKRTGATPRQRTASQPATPSRGAARRQAPTSWKPAP